MNKNEILRELTTKGKPFKIGMKELAKETGRSEWGLWNIFNGKYVPKQSNVRVNKMISKDVIDLFD